MTDWSKDDERAVGLSRFWPQSRSRSPAWNVRRLDEPGPAGQPGHAGLDQDAVDVDPAQARAEAVIADHHHRGASLGGEFAQAADRVIQPPDDLGGGVVPFGPVDPGLVHVEIRPDAVLEWVEVLELNHQHRPVGNQAVGEQAAVGTAAEALDGQPGVVR